jgi:GNAT superfamily N-acetyltransferase
MAITMVVTATPGLRILEYAELPPDAEEKAQLLDLSVGWGIMGFRRFDEARRMGYPASDYFAVYAVENGDIVSTVRVLRMSITTRAGVQQAAGIQGVVTRRDMKGRGIARRLLEEVHRRERAAGSEYSLLWTSHGLAAHRLYLSLGYRDVYTPELAFLRREERRPGRKHDAIRGARRDDIEYVENLHREATRCRLGFTPRPAGVVRSLLHLGFLEATSLKVILHSGEAMGYAILQKHQGGQWWSLEELVTAPGSSAEEAFSMLEAMAPTGWFVVRNTVVRDLDDPLRRRGFQFSSLAYYSLLALSLKKNTGDIVDDLGTEDRLFTCQYLDYF